MSVVSPQKVVARPKRGATYLHYLPVHILLEVDRYLGIAHATQLSLPNSRDERVVEGDGACLPSTLLL